jgi:hypothetical protein
VPKSSRENFGDDVFGAVEEHALGEFELEGTRIGMGLV